MRVVEFVELGFVWRLLRSNGSLCEGELTQYEQASQEQVSDGIRVGVALQGLDKSHAATTHVAQLRTLDEMGGFPRSRDQRATTTHMIANASAQPMASSAFDAKRKGSKRNGKGKTPSKFAYAPSVLNCSDVFVSLYDEFVAVH